LTPGQNRRTGQDEARALFDGLRAQLERFGIVIADARWEQLNLMERSDWLRAEILKRKARPPD
jgi:hypothetical protein